MKSIPTLSCAVFVLFLGCTISLNARGRDDLSSSLPVAITSITSEEQLAAGLPNIPELIELSGIGDTLRNGCNFTVFVPTIQSLRNLPQDQINLFLTDGAALRNFLGNYIIPHPIDLIEGRPIDPVTGLRTGRGREIIVRTLAGGPVLISDDLQTIRINGVPLTGNAAYSENGPAYEVADRLPEIATLQNTLSADPNFTISAALFGHPDVQNRMNAIEQEYTYDCSAANYTGGGFTCMVPTNDAWTRAGVTAPPSADSGLAQEVIEMVLAHVIPQYRTTNSISLFDSIVQTAAIERRVEEQADAKVNAALFKFTDDFGVETVLYGNQNRWGTVIQSNGFASDCMFHKVSEVYTPDETFFPFSQLMTTDGDLQEINFFATLNGNNYSPPPGTTWFAPNNDAFRRLPGNEINQFFQPGAILTQTIGSPHEFQGGYNSGYWQDLAPGEQSQPLVNERANFATTVTRDSNGTFKIGTEAVIIQDDIPSSDGILHKIDHLLTPPPDAWETIFNDPDLSIFAALIQQLDLVAEFQNSSPHNINVFAPTNDAWASSPTPDPEAAATQNPAQMTDLVRGHCTYEIDNYDQLDALAYSLIKDMQYNQVESNSGASFYGDFYVRNVEMRNGGYAEIQYLDRQLAIEQQNVIGTTGVQGGYLHEIPAVLDTTAFATVP